MKNHCQGIPLLMACLVAPAAVCEEGHSSAQPSAPATIHSRAFTIHTLQDACDDSPTVSSLVLTLRSTRIHVGDRINTNTVDNASVSDLIIEAFDADGNFVPSVPVYVGATSQGKTQEYDPGIVYKDASMDYWEARLPGKFDIEAGWLCVSDTQQAVRDKVTVEVRVPNE
jgi:hypothetical protein